MRTQRGSCWATRLSNRTSAQLLLAMVDQQQAGAISAAFPAPPPFYKDFTEENLERLAQIQESRSAAQETPSSSSPTPLVYDDLLELPHELRSSLIHLIPPPPPIDTYRSFGQTLTVSFSKLLPSFSLRKSLTSLPLPSSKRLLPLCPPKHPPFTPPPQPNRPSSR